MDPVPYALAPPSLFTVLLAAAVTWRHGTHYIYGTWRLVTPHHCPWIRSAF